MAGIQKLEAAAVNGYAEELEALLGNGREGNAQGCNEFGAYKGRKGCDIHSLEAAARAHGHVLRGDLQAGG